MTGNRRAVVAAAFFTSSATELCEELGTSVGGLSSAEAAARLRTFGPNTFTRDDAHPRWRVLVDQLRSPLLLLLVFAAIVSATTGEWIDAAVVGTILSATVWLGFSREYEAQRAAAVLRAGIRAKARVSRDGAPRSVDVGELVPGDIVALAPGSIVPADGLLLDARDLFVSEAALTGESFPAEKSVGPCAADAALSKRSGAVFMGTHVKSGTGTLCVARTGRATELGAIAEKLTAKPPEAEFERGVRRFGYLLTITMLVMVLLVFVAHVLRGRSIGDTLMFSIAIAVGLSPELLPAVLSVNLARGAQMMAKGGVLVRRLSAIENLGSMDVLCTDKTGTLTEGVVESEGAFDARGAPSGAVLEACRINASLSTGLESPLDAAILRAGGASAEVPPKLGEIPFDFVRKRASVIVETSDGPRLITKGAFHRVLEACTELSDGTPLGDAARADLERRFEGWGERGTRVLAVASRRVDARASYARSDERDLAFEGFVTFVDRPKPGVERAVADLARLGVAVKIITGDAKAVAIHVARQVGVPAERVLTGSELDLLHGAALVRAAEATDLFVEVDPNQKERIIASLRRAGRVTGFLGDGVNDAPAMHAADTSISVASAVDVAREAADFVLLEQDLDVIRRGIEEGRRTFANTLKYVNTTTSANLGNMVSMALASLFLPFLPLTAGQVLLNNFLSDIPAVGLASDTVDPELVERPRRWEMGFIARFMVEFGVLSSIFDLATFGLLLAVFRADVALFQTAWFVESLLTELMIALVVRTRRPITASRPGAILLVSTAALVPVTFAIPYLPIARFFGFRALPAGVVLALIAITVAYVAAAELTKRWFYRERRGRA